MVSLAPFIFWISVAVGSVVVMGPASLNLSGAPASLKPTECLEALGTPTSEMLTGFYNWEGGSVGIDSVTQTSEE